jgi:hypothetical protein
MSTLLQLLTRNAMVSDNCMLTGICVDYTPGGDTVRGT